MLLALVGITGVGKSFFTQKICERLDFKKVHTIRTRVARTGEDKRYFMSSEELDKLSAEGKIAYRFGVFGGEYGYLSDEIYSKDNYIFEMHYTTIYDWKKVRPDIKTIYIKPTDVEIAKSMLKARNLSPEKEAERLRDMEEHIGRMETDADLKHQFDYVFYNNYDKKSIDDLIDLIKQIMKK